MPAAREMVTRPSSSGCRIVSSTLRLNSGNSSRNSTPWCASEISPGVGLMLPPSKPGVAGGVMRRAKRTARHQTHARRQQAHDAVNLRGFQRLRERQRRQDGAQPLGEHGFAGAGRTDEEHIVGGSTSRRISNQRGRAGGLATGARWPGSLQ